MKKLICLVLAGLMVCFAACAEGSSSSEPLRAGEIRKLQLSDSVDVDGDGSADTIALSIVPDAEDDSLASYTLNVNGMSVSGEGISLTNELYVMKLGGLYQDILFLVPEMGESDDNACHLYRFDGDTLKSAGQIPSAAQDIAISGDVFTGMVRGATLQTWFRPGDYIIAHDMSVGAEGYTPADPVAAEAPRASYPVGTIVTLKAGLTLVASPMDGETVAMTLNKGDRAVISASDDASWIYIAPIATDETGEYTDYTGGYARIRGFQVNTDAGWMDSGDVFDGLCFAD